ncbi:unnamed protein product [Oncorhynchus mykiss]|uniref:C-type lectin domain-containing protein n=1 Tax=Oncorhynchus mykiss TaxID=8022 RepID=A0A060WIN4_ONCMY|nr:unnamed protein product [Oncorhynchus mykiss]
MMYVIPRDVLVEYVLFFLITKPFFSLYSFWEEGEPNNHIDEDCGYIVKTRKLERKAVSSWYDAPCTMYWPFICEIEM